MNIFLSNLNVIGSHLFARLFFDFHVAHNDIPFIAEKVNTSPLPRVSSISCTCCSTSRSFIMTKRDSHFAELPSPRTLNMESHDIDMPTAGPHSYAAPAIPGPDSHPQATSSTTPSSNHPPQIPPLLVSNVAHRGRPRQRVGHSILFKILEQPLPMGGFSREILVEETDARGYTQPKSLEFFFNGIIGHLRDRWGYALDYDRLCSQLANYWRSWFGAPTTGPMFAPPCTSGTVSEPEMVQVLQVAWLLTSIMKPTGRDTRH